MSFFVRRIIKSDTTIMHLILFFSRGVSLATWASVGMIEREIALYLRLQVKGVNVSFVTYGGPGDLDYASHLRGIDILCNRWNLPLHWYERLLPFLHARVLRSADVIKTNQTNGADVALRAARIWRKPLIARCGYMWSEFALRHNDPEQVDLARKIEKWVFENASRVVVTTHAMKEYVKQNYNDDADKVVVIPNYVLTDLFSPSKAKPIPNNICYIGRLHEQKNLQSLVRACQGLPIQLYFVGEGQLGAQLKDLAASLGVDLVMHGNLPHNQLPELICQSAIFALVSHYEGHPKSLLEAMSCGVAVLAGDSPGIREQIIHGETGWLVTPDVESIRAGIQHLLANKALREALGKRARAFVQDNYSLDKIVEMEYSLIQNLAYRVTQCDY